MQSYSIIQFISKECRKLRQNYQRHLQRNLINKNDSNNDTSTGRYSEVIFVRKASLQKAFILQARSLIENPEDFSSNQSLFRFLKIYSKRLIL